MEVRGFHLVYTSVPMVTWEDLVLQTVDLPTITPVFQGVNSNLMLVLINKLIVNHIMHHLVNTHTVYNSLIDLYCRELHRCLENVTPSHQIYFEFL